MRETAAAVIAAAAAAAAETSVFTVKKKQFARLPRSGARSMHVLRSAALSVSSVLHGIFRGASSRCWVNVIVLKNSYREPAPNVTSKRTEQNNMVGSIKA